MGAACFRAVGEQWAADLKGSSTFTYEEKHRPVLTCSRSLIESFPNELWAIIFEYASSRSHKWAITMLEKLVVEGNKVHCGSMNWTKIVSIHSVVDGPRKWKILVEFEEKKAGWIAIGVTLSAPRNTNIASAGWELGSNDDVLISTVQDARIEHLPFLTIVYERNTPDGTWRWERKSKGLESVVAVELSSDNKLMRVDTEGSDAKFVIPLQLQGRGPLDVEFRPCVVMSGCVSATIFDWSPETT
jgi:hypothetical protein